MASLDMNLDRRHFFGAAGLGAVGLMAGFPFADLLDAKGAPAVGRKFDAAGNVISDPGNSVIIRVRPSGPTSAYFAGLSAMSDDLQRQPFGQNFTRLPSASYHMTILDGATNHSRKPGLWPGRVSLDMPFDMVTQQMAKQLARKPMRLQLPIRMRIDPDQADSFGQVVSMRLVPADGGVAAKLSQLREQFSDTFQFQAPLDPHYHYHSSLAYIIDPLSRSEVGAVADWLQTWANKISARVPIINMPAPEFVSYKDVFSFQTVLSLS